MSLFLVKRLATLVGTLLFTSLVVFVVLEVLPGDPAQMILGIDATPEALATLRQQFGLNRSPAVRYFDWLGGLMTGNFGISYSYKVPVWWLIAERLALTLDRKITRLNSSHSDRSRMPSSA